MEVISEEEVPLQKARLIMEARKKGGTEMKYEQTICLDFLEKLPRMTEKQISDMVEELSKIAILRPRHIALIMNIMPDTDAEVDSLFSKERTSLKREEVKQIVDVVKQFKK